MNPVIDLLKSHRSIRKFTPEKIPRALFEDLIRAGQSAATSNHVQACSVIHVKNPESRERIAELAGGQSYVADCSHFLVFCADMKRSIEASQRIGADTEEGMTEQFVVATVDTALMAQNVTIAAESAGLGICYIGGIRNNPAQVSDILQLPRYVYPVFGLCLGYPDQQPEVKPRLALSSVLKEDVYSDQDDVRQVEEFDQTMRGYYAQRSSSNKDTTWSEQLRPLFTSKLRPHMREFLEGQGFVMK